jgi:hypothetical protein
MRRGLTGWGARAKEGALQGGQPAKGWAPARASRPAALGQPRRRLAAAGPRPAPLPWPPRGTLRGGPQTRRLARTAALAAPSGPLALADPSHTAPCPPVRARLGLLEGGILAALPCAFELRAGVAAGTSE